MKRITRLK